MAGTIRLSRKLRKTHAGAVSVPTYDSTEISPGIVHFGVGNFHRAHQAVYTDAVLASGDSGWAIRGAGITVRDGAMRQALAAQDFLYTVVASDNGGEDVRVVGAIVELLLGYEDPTRLVRTLADPETRVVSMTITENGYGYRSGTIDLDADNPAVRYDLRGGPPFQSVYGWLREAFREIRRRGGVPPTVLSCDNLPQNGDRLRKLFLQFIRMSDSIATAERNDLEAYVENEVQFPNCMVDRITPVTTEDRTAYLEERYGVVDARPVFCERFLQWVVEDRFTAGRPDWSIAGATFVQDVVPFERMKIRLLNGSHSALAYPAYLLGFRRVDLAMNDHDLRLFVERFMAEVEPTVGTVPGTDLREYRSILVDRFSNPAIADQVVRLAQDGSRKIPNMILEPVQELRADRRAHPFVSFAIAAWIRFLEGEDESGAEIAIDDPLASKLHQAALRTRSGNAGIFLSIPEVFPDALGDSTEFHTDVGRRLESIRRQGTRAALRELLREEA